MTLPPEALEELAPKTPALIERGESASVLGVREVECSEINALSISGAADDPRSASPHIQCAWLKSSPSGEGLD
jgi:hypothetical protein